jgi:hypothetical protein
VYASEKIPVSRKDEGVTLPIVPSSFAKSTEVLKEKKEKKKKALGSKVGEARHTGEATRYIGVGGRWCLNAELPMCRITVVPELRVSRYSTLLLRACNFCGPPVSRLYPRLLTVR